MCSFIRTLTGKIACLCENTTLLLKKRGEKEIKKKKLSDIGKLFLPPQSTLKTK